MEDEGQGEGRELGLSVKIDVLAMQKSLLSTPCCKKTPFTTSYYLILQVEIYMCYTRTRPWPTQDAFKLVGR